MTQTYGQNIIENGVDQLGTFPRKEKLHIILYVASICSLFRPNKLHLTSSTSCFTLFYPTFDDNDVNEHVDDVQFKSKHSSFEN